jgi:hypothetical protein
MADYSKATNFTAKDGLPSGNAGKIVKGTEIDTELTAISSAIASKSNINSPTFTGTPAAPTAGSGTNTTQIANTAFVKAAVDALGTIGTIASQSAASVAITGGTITGITDITVADGGTGASSITANSVILGNGSSALSGNLVAPSTSGNVLKSNGTTWTSAAPTVTSGLAHNGEVWNNVTSSRVSGTTYTNSRSYPIMISAYGSGAGSSYTAIYINGSKVYENNAQWNGAGAIAGGALIVPPGATYSISLSTGVVGWWELY